MEPLPDDILDKCHLVTASVKKNLHLLNVCSPEEFDIESLVGFNNRIVLSDSKAFLEAVRSDIGGEIIEDSEIGPFLYYGEARS
jgi:hypothetical protein